MERWFVKSDSACKFGNFFFFALKVNIYLQNISIKRRLARFDQKRVFYFRWFLFFCFCFFVCFFVFFVCVCNVPISELHAQWHWCLHFSMSLNFQRFLQFHPTIILVAYFNSCFIIVRQTFFPVSFSSSAGFPSADNLSSTTDFAHT